MLGNLACIGEEDGRTGGHKKSLDSTHLIVLKAYGVFFIVYTSARQNLGEVLFSKSFSTSFVDQNILIYPYKFLI